MCCYPHTLLWPCMCSPGALALAIHLLARPVDCRPLTADSMKSCASLPTHQLVVEVQAGLQVLVQAQQRRQPQRPRLARPPLGLAHGTTVCLRTCLHACGGSHAYALCVCRAPSRPLTPSTLCVSPGVPLRTQQAPRVVPSARLRNRRHGWSAEPKQLSDQNPLFNDVVRAIDRLCSTIQLQPSLLNLCLLLAVGVEATGNTIQSILTFVTPPSSPLPPQTQTHTYTQHTRAQHTQWARATVHHRLEAVVAARCQQQLQQQQSLPWCLVPQRTSC